MGGQTHPTISWPRLCLTIESSLTLTGFPYDLVFIMICRKGRMKVCIWKKESSFALLMQIASNGELFSLTRSLHCYLLKNIS